MNFFFKAIRFFGVIFFFSKSLWAFEFSSLMPTMGIGLVQPVFVGFETVPVGIFDFFEKKGFFFTHVGYFPLSLRSGKLKIKIFTVQSGLTYFPWERGVFFSAAMGFRWIQFLADTSSYSIDDLTITHGKFQCDAFIVALSVGYRWMLSSSVFLSSSIGAQMGLWGKGQLILENASTGQNSFNYPALSTGDKGQMDRIARLLLPSVVLIQLTWDIF